MLLRQPSVDRARSLYSQGLGYLPGSPDVRGPAPQANHEEPVVCRANQTTTPYHEATHCIMEMRSLVPLE
jgi:hypothetical protein